MAATTLLVLLLGVYELGIVASDGETHAQTQSRLLNTLLHPDVYDRRAIPTRTSNDSVETEYGMTLVQLLEADVKTETVSVIVWEYYHFSDYRLSWNQSEFGDISDIRIPATDVWLPDIHKFNSMDEETNGRARFDGLDVLVQSTGEVLFFPLTKHRFGCRLNLRSFPFDQHTCIMRFGSWMYSHTKLELEAGHFAGYGGTTLENPVWEDGSSNKGTYDQARVALNIELVSKLNKTLNVEEFGCCPGQVFSHIDFSMTLSRRSSFHVWLYFAPMALLQLLIPALFVMPVTTGNRYLLGSGLLVSLTMMLTNLDLVIPSPGGPVPLLGRYYIGVHVLIIMALTVSAMLMYLANRPVEVMPPPRIVKKVVFDVLARGLCLGSMNNCHTMEECMVSGTKPSHGTSHDWCQLARVLDRLFLVVFIILNVVVFLAFV